MYTNGDVNSVRPSRKLFVVKPGGEEVETTPPPDKPAPAAARIPSEEQRLIVALAAGDEAAFTQLIRQYEKPLLRHAMTYVASEAVAQEVVQDTWIAVMESIKRFEGRSSLKTWLYQILIHKAKTAGVRESHQVPLSSIGSPDDEGEAGMAALDAKMIEGRDVADASKYWATRETDEQSPEVDLLAEECRREIQQAIQALPAAQRRVLELYHFQELSSEEVCRRLKITETNKHVLLHRGRNQLKKVVDGYFAGDRRRGNTVRHVYRMGLAA